MSNVIPFKRKSTCKIEDVQITFEYKYLEDGSHWCRFIFLGDNKYSDWHRIYPYD